MNCCGHNNDDTHETPHKKHLRMMAICCGVPILLLLMLSLIGGIFPAMSSIVGSVVPLLCPVMMLGMMFFMFRGDKKSAGEANRNYCNAPKDKDMNIGVPKKS